MIGTPIQRDLNARIYAPGANAAVEQAAEAALAERWITWNVSRTIKEGYRQQHQGRRRDDTRCRKCARTCFALECAVDADKVV